LARQPQVWTRSEAIALAGPEPVLTIAAAKHELLSAFEPVPAEGTAMRAEWRKALTSRLNPLAAKIAPTMSKDQGAAWRDAMLDALADLPAMIGLTAAKRAIHVPMTFVNEVEGVIRRIADEIIAQRREAIARLERLIADLQRASEPVLPPPAEDVDPAATAAAIDRVNDPVLKNMLRGIARTAGFLPQDEAA
jgi:hypothetical protein